MIPCQRIFYVQSVIDECALLCGDDPSGAPVNRLFMNEEGRKVSKGGHF